MPIRRRKMFTFGAIAAGAFTPEIDVSEFTKGIVYAARAANGCVVTGQTSPDGGATWNELFDANEVQIRMSLVVYSNLAQGIQVLPKLIRFAVTVQDADNVWFEGIREVA
jgi:hypothetical protein